MHRHKIRYLENEAELTTFTLEQLPEYIHLFHFLAGYERRQYVEEDPVNIKAAELMGELHDRLKAIGYTGHALEVYLVRLLFCLFADDTGIFERDHFLNYLRDCTAEDGRDLAPLLAELFQVLNTPESQRFCTRNGLLLALPYVNGGLFAEYLPMPAFDAEMRQILIDCCSLDWGKISPAIFGSMFQSVMKPEERRSLGAHYTSERNILKLINPLFMDGLRNEFSRICADRSTRRQKNLEEFHLKLAGLNFLDPACGCGNFLVIAYRELRLLELEVIRQLESTGQMFLDIAELCKVSVDQFYGIEIEEFPAQIAQVAMWLMDHQMNIEVGSHFGRYFARIPLKSSATIVCANALRIDWETVVPKEKLSYIMGNPPFVGYSNQTKEQKEDIEALFAGNKRAGKLDFVAGWYRKAFSLVKHTVIRSAFVSTNSICQGEQASTLWQPLMNDGLTINFAYRTFKWMNEARGQAAVHCVIVGFSYGDSGGEKLLYNESGVAHVEPHINSYLTAAPDVFIPVRSKPLCAVPAMTTGNRPADGGYLIIEEEGYNSFIAEEPQAVPYIKRLLGSMEFINKKTRWCLWLVGISPTQLKQMPRVMERVEKCKIDRMRSTDAGRRKLAACPTLFRETKNPESCVVIPEVSSERRDYIPIGFIDSSSICTNLLQIIPDATLYHFGVLTSTMHMAWTRSVCGRLEMRYRYSNKIVYNNFPWPEASDAHQEKISALAQGVLDARALYPECSLADLYDPLTMPPELVAAHRKLDAAVEKAYGRSFADDAERVAFLFEKYRELTEK